MSDNTSSSCNNINNILAQNKRLDKFCKKVISGGSQDNDIIGNMLRYIPDDFSGLILDVPSDCCDAVCQKFSSLKNTSVVCLNDDADRLAEVKKSYEKYDAPHISFQEGGFDKLPFEDGSFDIVFSANGMNSFRNKNRAIIETLRVLKKGGKLITCFYIEGQSCITDHRVKRKLVSSGVFSPPFFNVLSVQTTFGEIYTIKHFHARGSMVYFCAEKK